MYIHIPFWSKFLWWVPNFRIMVNGIDWHQDWETFRNGKSSDDDILFVVKAISSDDKTRPESKTGLVIPTRFDITQQNNLSKFWPSEPHFQEYQGMKFVYPFTFLLLSCLEGISEFDLYWLQTTLTIHINQYSSCTHYAGTTY